MIQILIAVNILLTKKVGWIYSLVHLVVPKSVTMRYARELEVLETNQSFPRSTIEQEIQLELYLLSAVNFHNEIVAIFFITFRMIPQTLCSFQFMPIFHGRWCWWTMMVRPPRSPLVGHRPSSTQLETHRNCKLKKIIYSIKYQNPLSITLSHRFFYFFFIFQEPVSSGKC